MSVVYINIINIIPVPYPASSAAIAFSFQLFGVYLTILVALHFFQLHWAKFQLPGEGKWDERLRMCTEIELTSCWT